MKIKTDKIGDNILCLTFETRYEMGMTMVRLQEFYESPEFKGKYFTLEEYIDYWSENHGRDGAFDYPVRWRGYNLSGKVIKDWVKCFADDQIDNSGPLDSQKARLKEKTLYNIIRSEFDCFKDIDIENIYVIAVSESESEEERQEIIDHELSHAFYKLNPEYKEKCQEILEKDFDDEDGSKIKTYLKICLEGKGYHSDVFDDETIAYLATGKLEDTGIGEKEGSHLGITALRDNFRMFKQA